jgi:type IX secretion system PorP/SprF family membrane protein
MKSYSFILLFFICGKIYSQDPIFTQTFLVPETISSSFTGVNLGAKVGVLHRSQWTHFGVEVNTNYAYFDTWYEGFKSGIGVSILNHSESESKYTFNQINLNYALALQISDSWFFRPSISIGFGMKDYGFQNLLLEDQINVNTSIINTGSIDPILLNEHRNFFDFSSSVLFNNEHSWFGFTVKHLNKPNISMTQSGNQPLDIFISAYANIELPIFKYRNSNFSDKSSIYLLANYMKQSKYNRLDIGSQYVYDDKFTVGLLLATNPVKNEYDSHYLTSLNIYGGVKWNGLKLGYSYDVNTSEIGPTGGVHEISIAYDFSVNMRFINRYKCVRYF